MNSYPAFNSYEDRSAQPIFNAMARLLTAGPHGQNVPKIGEPDVTQGRT
jgi:hypothetical protein